MNVPGFKFLPLRSSTVADRRWIGNDDSHRNHHGVLSLSERPLTIALSWRAGKQESAVPVAVLELDLARLLDDGLVRLESPGSVRLRFYHDRDGHVYLQTRLGEPRIRVDRV